MGDLLARAAELVGIRSLSLEEAELADRVEAILRASPWLEVTRVGDNVVARSQLGRAGRLLFAGHLDTVPPPAGALEGGAAARVEGGTLWGLGATDMKGGLAVMLDLATSVHAPTCDVSFVFYVAEEIGRAHSGLLALQAARPDLLVTDVAVVCEPTGGAVEAGCQGVLKAKVVLRGSRAHAARPWMGRNAIHRTAPLVQAVSERPPRTAEIDGCSYREALQVVGIGGGVASNVVPDEAVLELNYRFPPDRDEASAAANLREIVSAFLEEGDSFEVTDSAPAAPPSLTHPKLRQLVELSGRAPVAKLGWTDVAFFAERGLPATNFGPGDPQLAHTAGENISRSALRQARAVLGVLVGEAA